MKSGIYKLIFSSGKCYIGKSMDVPSRWKQHTDRFKKGDAAGKMQQEYNKCGVPEMEVIFECHSDHIDIMETYCIHAHDRSMLLNTSIPESLSQEEYNNLLLSPEVLKFSTSDHVATMFSLNKDVRELKAEVASLRVIPTPLEHKLLHAEIDTHTKPLHAEIERLKDEVNYHKAQPWYSKIFS